MFWFSDARKAQRGDGNCYIQEGGSDCFIPNDYYIRNVSTSTVSLEIADTIKVVVPYYCSGVDLSDIKITFNKLVDGRNICPRVGATSVNMSSTTLYWISQDTQGRVISISEQYVP